jgi:hypothetical protein
MIVGFSGEDSGHRALIHGLVRRWCRHAKIVEGSVRGRSGERRAGEKKKILNDLQQKNAGVVILMTDGNGSEWRTVRERETGYVHEDDRWRCIFAVCDRNVECWLRIDRDAIVKWLGGAPADYDRDDPKHTIESALGVTRADRKEPEISNFVSSAPLHLWLADGSFRQFYEDCRDFSQRHGCQIENLRQRAGD